MENFQDPNQPSAEHNPSKLDIPTPDINDPDKFGEWLRKYVKRPYKGYEDKRHTDGSKFSYEELLEETRRQLIMAAEEFKGMDGFSDESIAKYMQDQAQMLSNPQEENH